MKAKRYFKHITADLDRVYLQTLIHEARQSLNALEEDIIDESENWEHGLANYEAAIRILAKLTGLDPEMNEMIENDIDLFIPNLN